MEDEQALCALYDLESHVLPHLNTITHTDPHVKYCLEQAKHHLKLAQELLTGAVLDPKTHFDDAQEFYQTLSRVLPLMVLARSFEPPPPDPGMEDNLPGTPSSDQSDEDSFLPGTPPLHSET